MQPRDAGALEVMAFVDNGIAQAAVVGASRRQVEAAQPVAHARLALDRHARGAARHRRMKGALVRSLYTGWCI